jgi:curli biogenesis system outer membrane secretion channel CsgG
MLSAPVTLVLAARAVSDLDKQMLKGRALMIAASCIGLTACAAVPPAIIDSPSEASELVEGPPVQDIVTPYDRALKCMRGKVANSVTFGVGQVVDSTGKETYAEGGTGKFISQGGGEMIQSALFRAGVTVVNRRDPNIVLSETNWGIRKVDTFVPVTFYVSGSINSLDFIPGGGASAMFNGVGPRYRQNRILVGLDLSLTDSHTGVVVANSALQKQVYAREIGFSADRFIGTDLIGIEFGGVEREALNHALRQMLNLATLELLGVVAGSEAVEECRSELAELSDTLSSGVEVTAGNTRLKEVIVKAGERAANQDKEPEQIAPQQAGELAPQKTPIGTANIPREAKLLARRAIALGGRSMSAAENAINTKDPEAAESYANEARQLALIALEALRQGAAAGLTGPEGDGAALLVEQAIGAAREAQKYADALYAAANGGQGNADNGEAAPSKTEEQPVEDTGPARPGSPDSVKVPGR